MKKDGIYRWGVASRAFLARSREALAAFDERDDVQQLFIAALMLRYGIEARLFEYIEAELPPETRKQDIQHISEFTATTLLARLTSLNPRVGQETTFVLHPEQESGQSVAFRYTPVTKSLAKLHGRLGGLLHFTYFRKNPYWFVAERSSDRRNQTLLDTRDLLARGIEELAQATAGDLLTNPEFAKAVGVIRDEANESLTKRSEFSQDESSNER
jgi:hypothetical protein